MINIMSIIIIQNKTALIKFLIYILYVLKILSSRILDIYKV